MKAIESGEIDIWLGFPKQPPRPVITGWNLGQTHSGCSPAPALARRATSGSAEAVKGTHFQCAAKFRLSHLLAGPL